MRQDILWMRSASGGTSVERRPEGERQRYRIPEWMSRETQTAQEAEAAESNVQKIGKSAAVAASGTETEAEGQIVQKEDEQQMNRRSGFGTESAEDDYPAGNRNGKS